MGIYESLITSGAWLTILKGLLTTVKISVLGLALGTVLGVLFCAARRSPRKWLSVPTKLIISFMRGTPVLLLLMMLYYVVFNGIRIDSVFVAVMAFGLNSGAHIAEIMRAALDCDAGINGLDAETKKQLMKISRDEKKKGIFGMIGKVFEYLSVPEADYNTVAGRHMVCHYGIGAEMSGYYWNPDFIDVLPAVVTTPETKENEKGEHDIELSIIEGYADDIHVLLQKHKNGVRLEITVVKNFTTEQTVQIEF